MNNKFKEVVVISGKGGTGKTSLAASFAFLGEETVMADCDVDGSDLHLLLHPDIKETHEFSGGKKARIDPDKCSQCGLCEENCRFQAIRAGRVEGVSCEGCHFCFYLCPQGAISMEDYISGQWFISRTRQGPMVHACLGIGAENSGKLVAVVRRQAWEVALQEKARFIITDGSPGIGCPVIASLTGADLALVVTEPGRSGFHDLARVLETARHFQVPCLVCINKYDLHREKAREIEDFCRREGIKLGGNISFDRDVVNSMLKGVPLVEFSRGKASREIIWVWEQVMQTLEYR